MIIVTGAAGFIASNMISKLNIAGYNDIVIIDDFSIKVKDNTDVIKSRWYCYWQDNTGSNIGSAFNQSYLSTNSPDWQLFETATTTAPAGAVQVKFDIRIYFTGTPAGESILLDDASLTVGVAGIPISKAYSVSETAIDVLYNADLTSVDPADYTLTGTANITFSSATIDGTNAKLVHLTGASASMSGDTTVDNIADAANSTNFDFYAGIMPIANTNTNNPDGYIDNTHLATFQGIVSANDAYNNVWVSDAIGAYNGVLIFDADDGNFAGAQCKQHPLDHWHRRSRCRRHFHHCILRDWVSAGRSWQRYQVCAGAWHRSAQYRGGAGSCRAEFHRP